MNITVTQRIGGGFALLVVLLLALSATSFRSLTTISQQLARTTEQINPIILHSADMAVALLSSNKAALVYMGATDEKVLQAQRVTFEQQQANYLHQRSELLVLAEPFANLASSIEQLDQQANTYFSTSDSALKLYQHSLLLATQLESAQLALRNDIHFFNSDLETIILYGISEAEKAAGRELQKNITSVETEFSQLMAARTLEELEPIEKSFNTKGYGFTLLSLEDRLSKLAESGNDMAADLKKFILGMRNAALAPNGLAKIQRQKIELTIKQAALIKVFSQSANDSSHALNQLMIDAQSLAADAKQETNAQVTTSQLINSVISLLSVLIAIIIGIWVSRNIRNSLGKVNAILKVIADGDLSQRLSITSKDEFGQLAGYVNELADKQEEVIREINQTADDIDQSAQQASLISHRTNKMMSEQQAQTIQVATAIQQMSATVSEVARSANEAQKQVSDIDNTASQNRVLMLDNVKRVNALASEIEKSSQVIEQLNRDSIDIGKILVVIEDIAGQTNLLALNAAIEAARAGEQGRGFAVVADEVRTLASRTQSSTQEIQTMIEKLQHGATNAVKIMKISRDQANESVEQTSITGDSLNEMVAQLDEIRQMSLSIASAAEQQTAVSSEISESVQQIAGNAELGAQDAQQSAQGSESLAKLAQRQKQMINQFKLH
ncbi:MAG: methyl-accepting chemotaxis protein [Oceanospirillaceae bacterium]